MGSVIRLVYCLQPTVVTSMTSICGYYFLSVGQESLWSGAVHCRDCLPTARLGALTHIGSGREHIEAVRSPETRHEGSIRILVVASFACHWRKLAAPGTWNLAAC